MMLTGSTGRYCFYPSVTIGTLASAMWEVHATIEAHRAEQMLSPWEISEQ